MTKVQIIQTGKIEMVNVGPNIVWNDNGDQWFRYEVRFL